MIKTKMIHLVQYIWMLTYKKKLFMSNTYMQVIHICMVSYLLTKFKIYLCFIFFLFA